MQSPPRISRLDPEASGRFNAEVPPPRPTRIQKSTEVFLFTVFGIAIVLAIVALWATFSPSHRNVPNTFDAGLKRDRINIVIIGIGGDAHPGGGKDLADAILFASLKPSTGQAAVASLPRDLWVPIGRYGSHRLNQSHALGERNGYPGAGPGLVSSTVSQITAQPVDAYIRIDFAAFEKVIDSLGGIDVVNPEGFYDYLFRDGFPRGPLHLDGKRALAYARYRYVLGPQGDNFARETRQQQVIEAVKEKLRKRSPQDVARMVAAMSTLSRHTSTNLTPAQLLTLYRRFGGIDSGNIRHVSLKPFTEVFTVTKVGEAGEALRTRTGTMQEVAATLREPFAN